MAKKKRSPLLELSSDIERDYILIDGEVCTIRSKQELSLVDYHWLKRCGNKTTALFGKDDLTEEETAELQGTVQELIDFIFIDTSKEIINKLSEGQKFEIMMAFTKLLKESFPEGAIETAGSQ